jgi:hypothetical protein
LDQHATSPEIGHILRWQNNNGNIGLRIICSHSGDSFFHQNAVQGPTFHVYRFQEPYFAAFLSLMI